MVAFILLIFIVGAIWFLALENWDMSGLRACSKCSHAFHLGACPYAACACYMTCVAEGRSPVLTEIIPAPVAYEGVPFCYVMQESDGRIVGVAPERRRAMVTEWLRAVVGRKVWQAYENT